MGKIGLVIDLTKRAASLVKAAGKQSILQTKPQIFKKGTVLAYEPKFNNSVKYYMKEMLLDSPLRDIKEVKSLARRGVNNDMKTWGRVLELKKEDNRLFDMKLLDFPAGKYDWRDGAMSCVMDITNNARVRALAKTNPVVAERMRLRPELFKLKEDEAYGKRLLDKAFSDIPPSKYDAIEYRGVTFTKNSDFHKNFHNMKKGDVITEPGYIWTSQDRGYAFGRYAAKVDNKISVKYNMLMPKNTKSIRMHGHHNENLMPFNSQYRVCDIVKDEADNMELFLEYIPKAL